MVTHSPGGQAAEMMVSVSGQAEDLRANRAAAHIGARGVPPANSEVELTGGFQLERESGDVSR